MRNGLSGIYVYRNFILCCEYATTTVRKYLFYLLNPTFLVYANYTKFGLYATDTTPINGLRNCNRKIIVVCKSSSYLKGALYLENV